MSNQLSEVQLEEIARLPASIQNLRFRYPISVSNAATAYNLPLLTSSDVAKSVEVYYSEAAEEADWFIYNGITIHFDPKLPLDPFHVRLKVNGDWAYIQIEGQKILDRLGNIKFPNAASEVSKTLLEF